MILTDKAKQDFLQHCGQPETMVNAYLDIYLFALIIQWLDIHEYHIQIEPYIGGGAPVFYAKVIYRMKENFIDTWFDVETESGDPEYFPTRGHATEASIKLANEIYNKRVLCYGEI